MSGGLILTIVREGASFNYSRPGKQQHPGPCMTFAEESKDIFPWLKGSEVYHLPTRNLLSPSSRWNVSLNERDARVVSLIDQRLAAVWMKAKRNSPKITMNDETNAEVGGGASYRPVIVDTIM